MKREALVVGINRYPLLSLASSKNANLTTPAADAEAIAQLLEKYGQFHVTRLPEIYLEGKRKVDDQGTITTEQLETAIANLFTPPDKSSLSDTALLFFAGHGQRYEHPGEIFEGYLATSEVSPFKQGLSMGWLRNILKKSSVRQQIVWLDCCHSGELLNFEDEEFFVKGQAKDRCLIAASRSFEVAYEEWGGKHGILGGALLEILNPEQQEIPWVSNYTLVDSIAQKLQTSAQRPVFRNWGGEILLTGEKAQIKQGIKLAEICPYKGLESFEFNDRDPEYFYGRTQLIDTLLEKIDKSNFVAVVGASGSGKSSVVKAGLLYQISLGQRISGSENWVIRIFRPGEHPLSSLVLAVADHPQCIMPEAISQTVATIQQLIETTTQGNRLILVIDQFEELFTLCHKDQERQRFFHVLFELLNRLNGQLRVIITLRADFFGKCAEQNYQGLAQKIQDNLETVTPMTPNELREAILQPANKVGLEVQRELVEKILEDVSGPGSLPLLQYTLTQLWREREFNRLTLAEYIKLGGVKGALKQRADEIYKQLTKIEQTATEHIFLELTQLGEGTEDTRRQVLKSDLIKQSSPKLPIETALQKLVEARLIVTSELQSRDTETIKTTTVVDVAHEALIRHWPTLRRWVDKNRDLIRQKRRIEEDAQEWYEEGKKEEVGLLLSGAKLEAVENYLEEHGQFRSLNQITQDYISTSRQVRDDLREKEESRRRKEIETAQKLTEEAEKRQKAEKTARKEAEQRAEQQRQANKKLKRQRGGLVILICLTVGLTVVVKNQRDITRIFLGGHTNTLNSASEALILSNKEFDGLLFAIRAAQPLQQKQLQGHTAINNQVKTTLQKALLSVQERNRFSGHNGPVYSVSFSPNGQYMATGSGDGTVKLWKPTGELIQTFEGHQGLIWSVAFSPDGQTIATGSDDKTVKLWNLQGQELQSLTGHKAKVTHVTFSPDGQTIASSSEDRTVKLWSLQGKLLQTIETHETGVWSVAFSPDGQTLASVDMEGMILLSSIEGKKLHSWQGHKKWIWTVHFSPDGQKIATGGQNGMIKLWNLQGEELDTIESHNETVTSIGFSPDGKTLASASSDHKVTLWNVLDGKAIDTIHAHDNWVWDVSFSPDSQTLATAGKDATVKLWNLNSRGQTSLFTKIPQDDAVTELNFSPDGQLLATVHKDKTARLWTRQGKLLHTLEGHDNEVWDVRFSPDGKTIATASSDRTVKLWDLEGELIQTLEDHKDKIWRVRFSPDGQTIATASSDKTAKLWNLQGEVIQTLEGHNDEVYGVSFSPDGQKILTSSKNGTVKLWSRQGKELRTLSGHTDSVFKVSFSPDGQTLVTASADKTAKIWSIKGIELQSLEGHKSSVYSATFSPDGDIIATMSRDGTTKLWTLEGLLLDNLSEHKMAVNGASFSPDGQTLATGSSDQSVILWQLDREHLKLTREQDLEVLMNKACDWVKNYLDHNHKVDKNERNLCSY
ncbi:MAG: caspase family protein [Crocosphaera sp.]|nr:caspase family protein [Crocosphaera sp.]